MMTKTMYAIAPSESDAESQVMHTPSMCLDSWELDRARRLLAKKPPNWHIFTVEVSARVTTQVTT